MNLILLYFAILRVSLLFTYWRTFFTYILLFDQFKVWKLFFIYQEQHGSFSKKVFISIKLPKIISKSPKDTPKARRNIATAEGLPAVRFMSSFLEQQTTNNGKHGQQQKLKQKQNHRRL